MCGVIILDWIMVLSLWSFLIAFIIFVIGIIAKDREWVKFSAFIAALGAIGFLGAALTVVSIQVLL